MSNFTWRGNSTLRYRSAPLGKVVTVEVKYSKGGMNMWNYKQEPRGIYIHVSQTQIEERESGIIMETFMVGQSGWKIFVKELQRLSAKQLLEVANIFEESVVSIAQAFERDRNEAAQMIIKILESKGYREVAA